MKRVFAIFLTCVFLLGLLPTSALAAEPYTGGLCPHHQEHSFEDCGYIEAVEGQPCGHVHDGDCGYVEAVPEVPCDMDCAETDGDGQIVHAEGCAYTPAVEGAPCQHEHNDECGYVPADPGQPCGYVCRICPVQAMIDALPNPEDITADSRAGAVAQLAAIDTARAELTGEEMEQLNTSRYQAVVSALAALDGQAGNDLPMPAAEGDVSYLYCDETGQNWDTGTKHIDEYTVVTAADATNGWGGSDVDKEYWYVVNSDVEFTQRVTVTGDVHLILTDGCNLIAKGGINVAESNSLTIYGQDGTSGEIGKLSATSGIDCASIGSVGDSGGGQITINGGTVTATGGDNAAGIGGGDGGSGGTITINGGQVTAKGGGSYPVRGGAGIGSGPDGSGGTITINGGNVTASGGCWGAGIGGGSKGSGGTITINGGTVIANDGGWGGWGIGNGSGGSAGTFSTGDSGSAFIIASSISDNGPDKKAGWSGVIFEGSEGQVYGTPTLETDATIPSDKKLEIQDGGKLTINNGTTLTNNGTIQIDQGGTLENNGTLTGNGTFTGDGKIIGTKLTQTAPNAGEGYSIDCTTEQITIESGYQVSSDKSNTIADGPIDHDKQLYVRKEGNNFYDASGWTDFTTPSRGVTPSVSIDYENETLNTTTAMQYASGQGVQSWESCSEDMAVILNFN